jgi:hypothetical protein
LSGNRQDNAPQLLAQSPDSANTVVLRASSAVEETLPVFGQTEIFVASSAVGATSELSVAVNVELSIGFVDTKVFTASVSFGEESETGRFC